MNTYASKDPGRGLDNVNMQQPVCCFYDDGSELDGGTLQLDEILRNLATLCRQVSRAKQCGQPWARKSRSLVLSIDRCMIRLTTPLARVNFVNNSHVTVYAVMGLKLRKDLSKL